MSSVLFVGTKLLQEALYPLNWAILFLLVSLLLIRKGRVKGAFRCQVIGLLFLIVPSTAWVSESLMRPLETTYPIKRIEDYGSADVIVVLGGTTAGVRKPRLEAEEVRGARLQAAARLFRAGKAKSILVTGGRYRVGVDQFRSEAEDMRDVLEGQGVPRLAIVMEQESRNTFENAKFTADLLKERGWSKVLLVTSALHMPRAKGLFAKRGVDAEPVPCSFMSTAEFGPIMGFKPDMTNMQNSESAIKEYVGRLVYWLAGRI